MKNILILFLSFFFLYACVDDNSAYLAQEKENVEIDNGGGDDDGETEEPQDGILVPGIHLIKLKVAQSDEIVERRFKYFMPISIDESKPISLIFSFHKNESFKVDNPAPDKLLSVSMSHVLNQHAIKENCIIVFPQSSEVYEDDNGYLNWTNTEVELLFFDEMLNYILRSKPLVDANRIYATGENEGGVFTYALAFHRAEKLAAIIPIHAETNIQNMVDYPSTAVAIRSFVAKNYSQFSSILDNISGWAQLIGGYFQNDMVFEEGAIEMENNIIIDTYKWNGGAADIELFSLQGITEVSLTNIISYMWDFMKSHPINAGSIHCFITSEKKEIVAQTGEKISIPINFTNGATVSLVNAPEDWQPEIKGKNIYLTAPGDYFGNINRKGTFEIKAEYLGNISTLELTYELVAPKSYFEVGDVYYNDDFVPVGVVCWVNSANIREAKIVNLTEVPGTYENINYGDFGSFFTPDLEDGELNTRLSYNYNRDNALGLTADNSAVIWAAEYSYEKVDDWYLPAINEWVAMYSNLNTVNNTLSEIGGRDIKPATESAGGYLSSTVIDKGGKAFQYFNFYTGLATEQLSASGNSAYFKARTMKKVFK